MGFSLRLYFVFGIAQVPNYGEGNGKAILEAGRRAHDCRAEFADLPPPGILCAGSEWMPQADFQPTIFGYGQGLVMAPLSNAVFSIVMPVSAGAASGIYGTTAQIAQGAAAIGAVFFAIESNQSSRLALLAALALFVLSIIACAAFLTWMLRVTR
jgi:hypothetical protein